MVVLLTDMVSNLNIVSICISLVAFDVHISAFKHSMLILLTNLFIRLFVFLEFSLWLFYVL